VRWRDEIRRNPRSVAEGDAGDAPRCGQTVAAGGLVVLGAKYLSNLVGERELTQMMSQSRRRNQVEAHTKRAPASEVDCNLNIENFKYLELAVFFTS